MPEDAALLHHTFYLFVGVLLWLWLVTILRGPSDEH